MFCSNFFLQRKKLFTLLKIVGWVLTQQHLRHSEPLGEESWNTIANIDSSG